MDQPTDIRTPKLLLALLFACAAVVPAALYAIFVVAPVEQQMGVVQKIFYIHMAAWNGMYIGFVTCAVCSGLYLWKQEERWDAIAVAGAEIGMAFCLVGMITGPLWGRRAWGVYWTWDPRLTSTLLEAMVFCAYLVLRSFAGTGEVERRFASGLAIVGLLDIPVIKYSVQRWRGTHPVVITGKGGGIHPDMRPALLLGSLLVVLLAVALIWIRARGERLRQRIDALELLAAERGWLEEG